jgi:hypothetical protein
MIDYIVDGRMYGLSYSDLRANYHEFTSMSDEDFIRNLPRAAHFACIVGWLKELGPNATIGDTGIVHELVHLMSSGTTTSLVQVRKSFAELLELR